MEPVDVGKTVSSEEGEEVRKNVEVVDSTQGVKDKERGEQASVEAVVSSKESSESSAISKAAWSATASVPARASEHILEREWTIWFDKKSRNPNVNYEDILQCLGSFSTVEAFWNFYAYLVRPPDLPRDCSYHLFVGKTKPMWESYPNGGSFILKIKRNTGLTARIWEELLFALIGESFGDSDLIGIVLSVKINYDVFSVWNRDANNIPSRHKIGDRLRQILHIDPAVPIEYKAFRQYFVPRVHAPRPQAYS